MSNVHVPAQKAIALQPGDGEALWFMGFLATIKAAGEETAGRVAVIHHLGPQDAGSPLHVHHREDEWFYVLDGELTIWVGGQVIRAPAGSFVFGPQGTPHTFTVSSAGGASFLLVTEPGGFEAFMRTCAEPPDPSPCRRHRPALPTPRGWPPSPPDTASRSWDRPASQHNSIETARSPTGNAASSQKASADAAPGLVPQAELCPG